MPRVTVVLRKAFGGAFIAMNSKDLGADMVLAWPQAQVGVMGAEQAVGIVAPPRDRGGRRPASARATASPPTTPTSTSTSAPPTAGGFIDEIVVPGQTRDAPGLRARRARRARRDTTDPEGTSRCELVSTTSRRSRQGDALRDPRAHDHRGRRRRLRRAHRRLAPAARRRRMGAHERVRRADRARHARRLVRGRARAARPRARGRAAPRARRRLPPAGAPRRHDPRRGPRRRASGPQATTPASSRWRSTSCAKTADAPVRRRSRFSGPPSG